MNNQSNNADIQYLVSIFEEQLNLLKDYGAKPQLDATSKAYLQSFISHVEISQNSHKTDITDFIDYGTKLMGYLNKNGIKNVEISNKAVNQILELMINPQMLREPILQSIQRKTKNNGCKQDIDSLVQALHQLDKKPLDYQKFKEKLGKVNQL